MEGLIRREPYMRMLRNGRDMTDLVKVVTGMRRSGKSTLLRMFMDELRESGVSEDRILMINFEGFDYLDIRDYTALNRILMERILADGITYVFLDEMQNVDGWEISVSALVETGRCDVYITGSNSKMLSSELATHLSGRFVEMVVLPLSFNEYLMLHPGEKGARFAEFLKYGALPEVDPSRGDEFCTAQLNGIFNTVLVQDIAARLKRSDVGAIRSIARFLYSNIGNETNIDRIGKELGISNDTVGKYVSMLTEAFLFHGAEKYDIAGRRILRTNGKFYASDLGLRNVALGGAGLDVGRLLENIVYMELVRRGYEVRIGSYMDREIDFIATRGGRVEYYQVCISMMDEGAREREFRSIRGLKDYSRRVIVTMDSFGLGTENGVDVVNAMDWLTGKERFHAFARHVVSAGARWVRVVRPYSPFSRESCSAIRRCT